VGEETVKVKRREGEREIPSCHSKKLYVAKKGEATVEDRFGILLEN